jgi:serine/threonine-protein kinase
VSVTCINGHENLDGMTFCEDCGVELTAITNTPPPTPTDFAPAPVAPAPVAPAPILPNPVPTAPPPVDPVAPIGGISPVQPLIPDPTPVVATPIPAQILSPTGGAYLEITAGPFVGRTFVVTEPVCLIGRWDMDSAAFPQIDLTDVDTDAKISRKHAKITKNGDQYVLEDLGSLNGTSYAGSPRLLPGDPKQLHDGDSLIMGRLFMRFGVR